MPNHLTGETSPYLLQHQNNPVDWYPWHEDALQKARDEQKPVFLSIGYAACHWCHVMEHESFEDEQIATYLNEHFVPIKVDREERPDLDQIYMSAVQMMTGRGGWPMSVFLTPALQPFFAGTYWPPRARMGMPGFLDVLAAVMDAWENRRQQAEEQAQLVAERIQQAAMQNQPAVAGTELSPALIHGAVGMLQQQFDSVHGGFGAAPKFPHPMDLQVLLRDWKQRPRDGVVEMVDKTLDHMRRGGIYDHLGGGFARYSVDERWLVPHFEKMLYDNSLLTLAYLEGFATTGKQDYLVVVEETLDYLMRDMSDEEGGFHSTEDADSEGVEGKYNVWQKNEIEQLLDESTADQFCYVYDVTEHGNWEGANILNLHKPLSQSAELKQWDWDQLCNTLASAKSRLLEHREQRIRPGKDDKVLVSWNGLAIDAFSQAAVMLQKPEYAERAGQAARFVLQHMRGEDGGLLHTWRNGTAKLNAYLDDYACLANGLVSLYEATWDEHWVDHAVEITEEMRKRFADADHGGFFYTSHDHESLIARPKDMFDSSVPSSSAMAAMVLTRLGHLCGKPEYLDEARQVVQLAMNIIQQQPSASG